jgi:hypothetical protein
MEITRKDKLQSRKFLLSIGTILLGTTLSISKGGCFKQWSKFSTSILGLYLTSNVLGKIPTHNYIESNHQIRS